MINQKIIDSFLFYNELDLLELRLEELYDHVDLFLIVESTKNFCKIKSDDCIQTPILFWRAFIPSCREEYGSE